MSFITLSRDATVRKECALNQSIRMWVDINHMAAGNPIANLVQALATIVNAFAQNLSRPNAPPSQM